MAKGNYRIVSGEVGQPIMAVWDDGTFERAYESAGGPNAGSEVPYMIPQSLVSQYQGKSYAASNDPSANTAFFAARYAPAVRRQSNESFVDKFAIPAFTLGLGGTAMMGGTGAIEGGAGIDALAGGAGSDALATGAAAEGATAASAGEFTGGLTGTATGSPGFSGLATGAPGLTTGSATGAGALAPGYFAAESLYPVLGGSAAAAGATGLGTSSSGVSGAAGPATGSALGNALGGAATTADWLRLAGLGAGVGLGMYGAGQQSDALRDIANQSRADRAPFLGKSVQYLNNPTAFLEGPGKSTMDAILRSLSVKGNPAGMPSSLDLAADASMRNWLNATTSLGNLGLSGEDTRAMLGAQAAGADASGLNALGYGIGQATNPQPTLADLLKQIGKTGNTVSLV